MLALIAATGARADSLASFLPDISPSELVPGADAFGPVRSDVTVAPVLKGGETVAWAFLTSDFVGTTGYSGKPIHVVAAKSICIMTGPSSEQISIHSPSDARTKPGDSNCRIKAKTANNPATEHHQPHRCWAALHSWA